MTRPGGRSGRSGRTLLYRRNTRARAHTRIRVKRELRPLRPQSTMGGTMTKGRARTLSMGARAATLGPGRSIPLPARLRRLRPVLLGTWTSNGTTPDGGRLPTFPSWPSPAHSTDGAASCRTRRQMNFVFTLSNGGRAWRVESMPGHVLLHWPRWVPWPGPRPLRPRGPLLFGPRRGNPDPAATGAIRA